MRFNNKVADQGRHHLGDTGNRSARVPVRFPEDFMGRGVVDHRRLCAHSRESQVGNIKNGWRVVDRVRGNRRGCHRDWNG